MRLFSKDIMLYSSPKGWSVATQAITEPYVHNYCSIAYGDGKFVVINDTGAVLTSTDTLTWTLEEIYVGELYCKKIIHDGSKFVVMTESGVIKTSTNLSSWSWSQSLSSSYYWRDLIYNGSLYIALGVNDENGFISISSDLSSWSTPIRIVLGTDKYWRLLAFNNNKIIAFADNGYVSHSTNGTTWSEATKNYTIGENFGTVIYANKFTAIGDFESVFESTDGDTWVNLGENVNLDVVGAWVSMTKNDNTLVAITNNGYISTKRI